MVLSQIKEGLDYGDLLNVVDDDLDHDASVYESEILGKNVEIVLGKVRVCDGMGYCVSYLILNTGKVRPIGIFEVEEDRIESITDEDGDMDVEQMTGPLLFSTVDLSDSALPDTEVDIEPTEVDVQPTEVDVEATEVDVEPTEVDVEPTEVDVQPTEVDVEPTEVDIEPTIDFPIAQRNKEESEREMVSTGLWIQKLMSNKNYSIVDNEGGGDCLFAVIRDAFEQIGKTFTVGDLRKKLSEQVTEDMYLNYRSLYESFSNSVKDIRTQLTTIATENNALKEKLAKERNHNEQVKIVEHAKKLKERFYFLKDQLTITQEMMKEYVFMKGITSFDQFRAAINTCRFWGDSMTISIMEQILNTKFVVLSQETFDQNDIENVIQCGETLNNDQSIFTPDYYIIMDYNGSHYKLITYKDQRIFEFKHLPYAVRDLITNKCLEAMGGVYSLIPDFAVSEVTNPQDIETSVQGLDFNPDIIFMYYGRSSALPLPGKGTGEKIPHDYRDNFKTLASIKDWRKKLSNEWVAPIDVDGYQWQTVEHYYQASKYIKGHPEIYYQFTLDSRSELGKSVERVKSFDDFEPDMDFAGKYGKEVLAKGLEAKFTQHPELRKLLLATLDASLREYRIKSPPRLSVELMALRKNLKVL
jgi:predicted NAD-dependent protein-ADP-ribosyltransferase YbiA (DUF1768 family)